MFCKKITNLLVYLIDKFLMPKNNFKSLESENFIDIIEVFPDQSDHIKNNIRKYLIHHIYDNTIKFENIDLDEKIEVFYNFNNNKYRIVIKKIQNTLENCLEIVKQPKILHVTSKEFDDTTNYTEIIKQYHGPHRNFFKHNSDICIEKLKEYENINSLYVLDITGTSKKFTI